MGRFFLMVCSWVDSLIIIIKVSSIIRVADIRIPKKSGAGVQPKFTPRKISFGDSATRAANLKK